MTTPQSPGLALLLLSLAAFASAATTRICDGMLPQIATDFAVTPGAAAQVITAYSASYGLCQVVWGLAGDRFGKARIILVGMALSLITTLACALAPGLASLTWARLAAGIAAAGIVPLSLAWIGDSVPYELRQATIARFITGQIMGVIAGLSFGGIVGEVLGWRAAFWVIGAIYIFAATGLALRFPRTGPPTDTLRAGAAILRLGSLFGRPWVRVVLLTTALEGFLCFGALAYVTSELHGRFGVGFAAAGLSLATFGLGGLAFALAAPRIVPRFGEVGGARAAAVVFVVAFALYTFMPAAWVAIPASFFAGLGYYLLHNVSTLR